MTEFLTKGIIATVGGVIAWALGGFDQLLSSFVFVVFLDYISGICKAIYKKELSSKIGFGGIARKVGYFIVIALAFMVGTVFDNAIPIRELVITFFIANEGISILENVSEMDVPYTQKLKDILQQLAKKGDDNE